MLINQTGATSTNKLFTLEFSFKCQPDLISFPLHFHIFLLSTSKSTRFHIFQHFSHLFFHLLLKDMQRLVNNETMLLTSKKKNIFFRSEDYRKLSSLSQFLRLLLSQFHFQRDNEEREKFFLFLEIRYFWAGRQTCDLHDVVKIYSFSHYKKPPRRHEDIVKRKKSSKLFAVWYWVESEEGKVVLASSWWFLEWLEALSSAFAWRCEWGEQ